MRIFLSYRRDDASAHAGRLHDALVHEFGAGSVFQDVVAIGAGEDFTQAIDRALDDCDATLVVIGPSWLAPEGSDGRPRLYEDGDYVRIEVAEALTRDMKVVPVLVGGARMPTEGDLPNHLQPLAKRQAVVLRDDTWHNDVTGLVRSLRGESHVPTPKRGRNPWLIAGIAVAIIAIAALAGVVLFGGDGGSEEAEPPPCTVEGAPWTSVAVDADAMAVVPTQTGGTLEFQVIAVEHRALADGSGSEVALETVMTSRVPGDPEAHGYWQYDELVVDGFVTETVTCAFVDTPAVGENQKSRARIGFEVAQDPSGSLTLVVEASGARALVVLVP